MPEFILPASFRDPSGFMFERDGVLFRQINPVFQPHYDHFITSGLYETLARERLIIRHEDLTSHAAPHSAAAYKTLKPERIPFILYPYEMCFSQLKDAALATLQIQKLALAHGMSLKDASAYNVQFHEGTPLLIDTLSLETHEPGTPWVAYRQFCQHFLAPLALMSLTDIRLHQLLRTHIDGVPLDLASTLLGWSSHFRFGILAHLHFHARAQRKHSAGLTAPKESATMSSNATLGVLSSLENAVHSLKWASRETEWSNYYEYTNYSSDTLLAKQETVSRMIAAVKPTTTWDLGANTGRFSRLASRGGAFTVAFDMDPGATEINYLNCKADGDTRLLPVVMDLSNPSPSLGWDHDERDSLKRRGPADLILALALIHHLAISNNVPLRKVSRFLSGIGKALIIEWVPKADSNAQRLLHSRKDVFDHYTQTDFDEAFEMDFHIHDRVALGQSGRVLYRMETKA